MDEIGFISSDSPSVSQIDLGYDLGNNWGIAGAYQVTDDGAVLGMPESRTTLGVATSAARGMVSISFEYWRDEGLRNERWWHRQGLKRLCSAVGSRVLTKF